MRVNFNVEIDGGWLQLHADHTEERDGIESFFLGDRCLHLLAEGRLVNLATPKGMGHPIEVMDLSFAVQALSSRYIAEHGKDMRPGVHEVPAAIDEAVAREKLSTLGITIDILSPEQEKYMGSWEEGT